MELILALIRALVIGSMVAFVITLFTNISIYHLAYALAFILYLYVSSPRFGIKYGDDLGLALQILFEILLIVGGFILLRP